MHCVIGGMAIKVLLSVVFIQAQFLTAYAQVQETVPNQEGALDAIFYNYVDCQAEWYQSCEGVVSLTAPTGYQVCKMIYKLASYGRGSWIVTNPDDWYPDDTEAPPRFHTIYVTYKAHGSIQIWDQWGSHTRLEDLGIRVIPQDASNAERETYGCWMPAERLDQTIFDLPSGER